MANKRPDDAQDAAIAQQVTQARQILASEAEELSELALARQPAHRLPREILIRVHQERRRLELLDKSQRARRIVVAAGPKHCSGRSVDSLSSISLRQCVLGINRGKFLLLRTIDTSYRTAALHILTEDPEGWSVQVAIYHAAAALEENLMKGTVLIIREPWLKPSKDGYAIRVDSPADLEIWPEIIEPTHAFRTSIDVESERTSAARAFGAKRYGEAAHAYERGVYANAPTSVSVVLRLNAAAAYLNIDDPARALYHLDRIAVDQDILTPLQKDKFALRKLSALYRLGRYTECLKYEERLPTDRTLAEAQAVIQKAQARMSEAQTGTYPWSKLYQSLLDHEMMDLAEFSGPVRIETISGRGRGLVAARNIASGELLVVAAPLARSQPQREAKNLVLGLNLSSESLDTYTQTDLPGIMFAKARQHSSIRMDLLSLYAGPAFRDELTDLADTTGLDAGRLEGIVTFNSFKPESLSAGHCDETPEDGASENHLHTPSAVYLLPSMMNHSCLGNAGYTFWRDTFVLRATADIQAGDEITDSYCDASEPLEQRRDHLRRYGFTCTCQLCQDDELDGITNRAQRRHLMQSLPCRSLKQARQLVNDIAGTYRTTRKSPKPDLYRCYRSLALHLPSANASEIVEIEIAALECLGAKVVTGSNAGALNQETGMLSQDPLLMLQDAILSCCKLSHNHLASDTRISRSWGKDARRMHAKLYGPDLFDRHMSQILLQQGWSI